MIPIHTQDTPLSDWRVDIVPEGCCLGTVVDRVQRRNPQCTVVASLNGEVLNDNDTRLMQKLRKTDTITIQLQPHGLEAAAIFLISVVVGAALYVILKNQFGGQTIDQRESNRQNLSAFSLRNNTIRRGGAIPVLYGTYRFYPDLISDIRTYYDSDNQEWMDATLVITQGEVDNAVGDVYIGDTPISEYEDVTITFNHSSSNYADNNTNYASWYLSNDATNIELINDADDGKVIAGDYILNPPSTSVDRIQYNISFRGGLFGLSGQSLADKNVTLLFSYKRIDDDGDDIDASWTTSSKTYTAQSETPLRFTETFTPATSGRFKVRVERTSLKDDSTGEQSGAYLQNIRGRLTTAPDLSQLTTMRVVARITNNIQNSNANRISIVGKRKLRTWSSSGWSTPTTTRSIIWAILDLLTNEDYGAGIPDSNIDLPAFKAMDDVLSGRGDTFNYVFKTQSTIWETIQTIARAGRCIVILQGSTFTIVRDRLQTTAVAMFSPRNTVKEKFNATFSIPTDETPDGVRVEYIEEGKWYTQYYEVNAAGGTPSNPREMKLTGITDLAQLKREALYEAKVQKYRRQTINITTELEGHLPLIGEKVIVGSDIMDWGISGDIVGLRQSGNRVECTLSNPVNYGADGTQYKIALRNKTGAPTIVDAYAGVDNYTIELTGTLQVIKEGEEYSIGSIILLIGSERERTHFLFGVQTEWQQYAIVKSITPRGNNVQLSLLEENDSIHTGT